MYLITYLLQTVESDLKWRFLTFFLCTNTAVNRPMTNAVMSFHTVLQLHKPRKLSSLYILLLHYDFFVYSTKKLTKVRRNSVHWFVKYRTSRTYARRNCFVRTQDYIAAKFSTHFFEWQHVISFRSYSPLNTEYTGRSKLRSITVWQGTICTRLIAA